MTTWQYVATEARTGRELADLPLSGVKLSRTLNGSGSLSGTLPLGVDPAVRRILLDAVDPGRRAVYALADGVPVWGGIVWQAPRDDTVTITAGEWGSYFAKVTLRTDLYRAPVEQLDLARLLVSTAQGVTGGDVRVALGTETSGVLRDLNLLASDVPVVTEQLDALANMAQGFDYAWPAERDSAGLLRGRLLLGYPRLGRTDAALTIESPGTRGLPGFALDASGLATTAFAVGAGGVVASSTDPAMLDAGYPVLDRIERYTDTSDSTDLQAHADADQDAYGGALATVTATVGLDLFLSGDLQLGDLVHVELHDHRFPDAFTGDLRLTAVDLDPQAATCGLTLSPRVALGGRIPRGEDTEQRVARLSREVRYLAVSG